MRSALIFSGRRPARFSSANSSSFPPHVTLRDHYAAYVVDHRVKGVMWWKTPGGTRASGTLASSATTPTRSTAPNGGPEVIVPASVTPPSVSISARHARQIRARCALLASVALVASLALAGAFVLVGRALPASSVLVPALVQMLGLAAAFALLVMAAGAAAARSCVVGERLDANGARRARRLLVRTWGHTLFFGLGADILLALAVLDARTASSDVAGAFFGYLALVTLPAVLGGVMCRQVVRALRLPPEAPG
ncbi:hypothetical protein [Streptoalloteichus tenebrarius]|nr:hypothetical protein [Streptoalloteichus tenebrarius]